MHLFSMHVRAAIGLPSFSQERSENLGTSLRYLTVSLDEQVEIALSPRQSSPGTFSVGSNRSDPVTLRSLKWGGWAMGRRRAIHKG